MNDANKRLPRVTPMPTPPRPPEPPRRNNTEGVYAEEALRVAQRHLDQVDEIARLGLELDEWRRRALMAESEIKRLEKRENDLTDAIERQQEKLLNERDDYRNRLNNLVSQFHSAGAIILRCIDAASDNRTGGSQVDAALLAQELNEPQPGDDPAKPSPNMNPDEPLPRVITAGPKFGPDDPAPDWLTAERKGP